MSTPHLPVEIHNIICAHLAREDLRSYRKTHKYFAEIGAQYLFRHLSFHASYASLDRIANIGSFDYLADLVEIITWNTSSISLDVSDLDDWKILNLRCQASRELRSRWYKQTQDNDTCEHRVKRDFERYKTMVAAERDVQVHLLANLRNFVALFPKLRAIVVEKNRNNEEDFTFDLDVVEPQSEKLVQRGVPRRRQSYKQLTDLFPIVAALNAAQVSTYQVELRALRYNIFSHVEYGQHLNHVNVSQITHLHLRFALLDPFSNPQNSSLNIMNCRHVLGQGYLRSFLQKFSSLQSLGLDFEARSLGNGRAPANLQDIFAEKDSFFWPKLQHLAIYHADTSPSNITTLLVSQASSLRTLSLGDICLDPPGSWETVLTNVQPHLSLSSVTLSRLLFDARIESFQRGRSALLGWYCGDGEKVQGVASLGSRLEEFMVKGGACPLREEEKVARVVGRMDDLVGGGSLA